MRTKILNNELIVTDEILIIHVLLFHVINI